MRKFKGIKVLGLAVVLAAQVAACASAQPGARQNNPGSGDTPRTGAAWAQGYQKLQQAYLAEQARLTRADAAYAQRMTKLAEYVRTGGKVNWH